VARAGRRREGRRARPGYLVHANFEEQWFLPLAERILGRDGNHMAALGMALHLRHAKVPAGYV
jgi:hypothetical protein